MTQQNERRQINGRIGAYESWARTSDRTARTAPARAAFMARFDEYPDPEAARKAYFARIALKSARTRQAKKAAREAIEAARLDAEIGFLDWRPPPEAFV